MENYGNELSLVNSKSPVSSFLLVLVFAIIGFTALGPFVGVVFALPFDSFNLDNMQSILTNPAAFPDAKVPLLLIQGISSVVGFMILPALVMIGIRKTSYSVLFKAPVVNPLTLFITCAFVISFMVVNSVFVDWNANIHFPEFMGGFDQWARKLEDSAQELTEFLTTFDNVGQFLVAFLVIALIPAIGEEFVFRGLLQNYARGFLKNDHAAVWFVAFLFSAFHLQFFGFVPRLLLGVTFGYLYLWSGNLIIPMLAHLVNNGFTLIMLYLYHLNKVDFNIETADSPSLAAVIPFFFITIGLLYYFYKLTKRLKESDGDMAEGI